MSDYITANSIVEELQCLTSTPKAQSSLGVSDDFPLS